MGYLIYYIEGPLLWFSIIFTTTLIFARSAFAFSTIFFGINHKHFEWTWTPLPDLWVDWMTITVLLLTIFFLLKRCILIHTQINSTKSDYFLLITTGLPFLTGYCLTHGALDSFPLLSEYLFTVHILSGEVFLLVVCFLFYRTNLNSLKCIGCLACTVNCPTGTLESHDNQKKRKITYSHYQCICCGECVSLCPYEAAELRHEISFFKLFQIGKKYEIQQVDLNACENCGNFFIPLEQLRKIRLQRTENYICLCPACKQLSYADSLYQAAFNKIGPNPDLQL